MEMIIFDKLYDNTSINAEVVVQTTIKDLLLAKCI